MLITNLYSSSNNRYPDGCWRAGDALVLDSRILYRGEHSVVFKPGILLSILLLSDPIYYYLILGVMLVFRYDFEGHEAPGISNMQRKVIGLLPINGDPHATTTRISL